MTEKPDDGLRERVREVAANIATEPRDELRERYLAIFRPDGYVDHDDLLAFVRSEITRRDGEWREAIAPGNAETTLGEFVSDPKRAAMYLAEEITRAADEANSALRRIRANWPHIEIVVGGEIKDPGSPVCLRCKIERLIDANVRGVRDVR